LVRPLCVCRDSKITPMTSVSVAVPDFIRRELESRALVDAFERRPESQRKHYIRRIIRAARNETVQRRLDQMLDELEGDLYMKRAWSGASSRSG
jgi:hypothetical protein